MSGWMNLLQSGTVSMTLMPVTSTAERVLGVWAAAWDMLVLRGHPATCLVLIWLICNTSWGHNDTWVPAVAKDHV